MNQIRDVVNLDTKGVLSCFLDLIKQFYEVQIRNLESFGIMKLSQS